MMERITSTKDLKPGNLYCCVHLEVDPETGEEYESFGELVWFAPDGFYDSDTGEERDGYADFYVPQYADQNPEYM